MEQTDVTTTPAAKSVSPAAALVKVLFEPKATFESLREKAPWILPFLVTFVLIAGYTYVNWSYLVDSQMDSIRSNEGIPAETKTGILEDMRESRDNPSPARVLTAPLFVAVLSLIGAAIWLLIGNVVLGGDASYKQLWSAYNYAGMVGMVEGIIKSVMIQMKGSAEVYTSLALLAPELDTYGFTFRALDAIDIFSLWFFGVMAVGVAAMCKVRSQKAMVVSYVVWAIWAFGIKAGLGSLVGQYVGM